MQDRSHSFGYWLRRRRKALDLTQQALAQRVSCSVFSIRKVEADERRPSRRLAERLAATLALPEADRGAFLAAAREVRGADRLRVDTLPAAPGERADAPANRLPPSAEAAPDRAAESTPFVGRGHEFELLSGLIAQLAAGAGHTVFVEGEPGIGKSRLLREVTQHAQARHLATLATKCYEIERAMPYQPVIDLVTRAFDRVPAAAFGTMAPVSLAELNALVPAVGARFADLPRLSNDFPEARQARLSRAVGQLLEAAAQGRPSLLVVDDLQWADDASAQVFHYLARTATQRPVLVVYACREDAVACDERLARLVQSLCRESGARRLPLTRLNAADTETLVAALAAKGLETRGLVERLHRETEGNPFFLTSILQSLSAGEMHLAPGQGDASGLIPDTLRDAVRARLAHVPARIRPVLETAAVLGRHFGFETLLEAVGAPEAQLLDAVDALVRRRLLREEPEGGGFDFSHDKIREVAYRDIGGARRRLLHRAVAEALERRGERHPLECAAQSWAAQLAEHFERAQIWPKALRYLVLAGERSQALFALRDALHWLDRAVALADAHPESQDERQRLAIHERRGAARAQAGQAQGAVADMRHVVDALRGSADRARTRDALVQLGMAYRRADAYDEATECLAEALTASRAMNDDRHAADTLYHLGTVAWSTGQNDRAIGFHQQAVEICERTGFADLVAVQAYHGRGEAHYANAEPAAAIDCFRRSLELARVIGDRSYESENLMMIGHACVGTKGLGHYPLAMENFEAALEIARAADLQWHIGPTLLGMDHARACTGHYGQAWSGMRETLQWLEGLGQTRYQLIAHDFIGQLLLDLDLNELAVEQLERGLALARDTGIMFWNAAIAANLAVARSRLGHQDAALALQALVERTRRTSERYLLVRCIDGLAETALAAGDARRCSACGTELLAIAGSNGLREIEAAARRWRGEAWLADRAYPQAQAELGQAAALADEVGRVRLQMDVQAALARLSGARGDAAAASHHGDRARQCADIIDSSLNGARDFPANFGATP